MHLLDGQVVEQGGLRIGGVGGIVGDPARPERRPLEDFLDAVLAVLAEGPHVLVLHEGPPGLGRRQPGLQDLEALVAEAGVLTVCGHRHWPTPLAQLEGGQVLNVDARAVLLRPAE